VREFFDTGLSLTGLPWADALIILVGVFVVFTTLGWAIRPREKLCPKHHVPLTCELCVYPTHKENGHG
jgi:hypothetical protein